MSEESQATLRDVLEQSMNEAEESASSNRDEKGRFTAAKEEPAPVEAKPEEAQEVPAEEIKRPSTWKKELEPLWPSLPKEVRDEILRREGDYAKGVSTYKAEWEQAKPLLDAMAPFQSQLQQYGIKPDQWIGNLGRAHQVLALGNPQEKLSMFAKLAAEYGVPLNALLQGGQSNDQIAYLLQKQNAMEEQVNGFLTAQQQQQQAEVENEIAQFAADATNHPHFEAVKATMGQLLGAGLADDLNGAYAKAIRMHDDVWQSEQQRLLAQQQATEAEKKRANVQRAKGNAISPRGGTPAAPAGAKPKGLRDMIASAVDEASASRV